MAPEGGSCKSQASDSAMHCVKWDRGAPPSFCVATGQEDSPICKNQPWCCCLGLTAEWVGKDSSACGSLSGADFSACDQELHSAAKKQIEEKCPGAIKAA